MTQPDKLTIEELELIAANQFAEYSFSQAGQLALLLIDSIRENQELKKHPLKLICEKCNILTNVQKDGTGLEYTASRRAAEKLLSSKHLETEGSGVQNAEAATMSKENVAHCNHYWKKIADTQYCEDCGIEFYQAQSTKTPLPTIDYSESQSTVCPHCQGYWYGCSKNQRLCSEGK